MLLKKLKAFVAPAPYQQQAHSAYLVLVAQARNPVFYQKLAVPDTVDGRFDLIALHMFLVVQALRTNASLEALEFARALSEVFFSDMDRSLREMGSTDTGTGMRVKNMAQAFYGRMDAYAGDNLKEALKRNLYRGADIADNVLQATADYMRANLAYLSQALTIEKILSGQVAFTQPI